MITHRADPLLVDPFLLRDLRQDLRLLAAERAGALIEGELDPLGQRGLIKLPQAGLGRGVTIEGRLLLPTARGHVELTLRAHEGRQTGKREAEVLMHTLPAGGGVPGDWSGDPYDHVPPEPTSEFGLERPPAPTPRVPYCKSDAPDHDARCPDHPLARVRRLLGEIPFRLQVTDPSTIDLPRGRSSLGEVRFFLPIGYLPAQELPHGRIYQRPGFDGRVSWFRIARRPDFPRAGASLEATERLVTEGLRRLKRAVRAGPRVQPRRFGRHSGVYAEAEWEGPVGPLLAASAFLPWRAKAPVEVTRVGPPADWARITSDLDGVVRSLGTYDDEPPRLGQISPNGRRRIYRILCWLAHCDGAVPRSERRVLDAFRERCGIEPVDAARLEAQALAQIPMPVGANQAERDQLAASMLAVVTADGVLDPSEQSRTVRLAELLGFTPREWFRLLQDGLET